VTKLAIVLSVTAFLIVSGAAFAAAPDQPVKWSQLPEMQECWGKDLPSSYDPIDCNPKIVVMDDWKCTDGRPVTDVHWWGSYIQDDCGYDNWCWGGHSGTQGPIIGSFKILIFSDVPATTGRHACPSHPGTELACYDIPFADTGETYYSRDENYNKVYQYNVDLPTPFDQVAGQTYWLGIVAVLKHNYQDYFGDGWSWGCGCSDWGYSDDQKIWGWHTAVQPENLDDSVTITNFKFSNGTYTYWSPNEYIIETHRCYGSNLYDAYDYGYCQPLGCGNQQKISLDMAFELTTIPEPTTIAMVALGGFLTVGSGIIRTFFRKR
jgi:hypothetical protein